MSDKKLCEGCERAGESIEAKSWCADCGELVCKNCAKVHTRLALPHNVVPWELVKNVSPDILNVSKVCSIHPNQSLVMFCCQHDLLVCSTCASVIHKACKPVIAIENAAKGVKGSTAMADLEGRMTRICEIAEKSLVDRDPQHEKEKETIIRKISDMKLKIYRHLEKIEASTLAELDEKYQVCNESVQDSETEKANFQKIHSYQRDIKTMKTHFSEIHFFRVIKHLNWKIHEIETELDNMKQQPVNSLQLIPHEQLEHFFNTYKSFGSIEIRSSASVFHGSDSKDGQFNVQHKYKGELSLVSSFKTTNLGEFVVVYSGCAVSDDKLLFSDDNDKIMHACNIDGSEHYLIGLLFVPFCVARFNSSYAIVSGAEGFFIQFIDIQTMMLAHNIDLTREDKDISIKGMTTVNGRILIAVSDCSIIELNEMGQMVKSIKTNFEPYHVSGIENSSIFCTPFNDNKVRTLTTDGTETIIYDCENLSETWGIAADDGGFVYVSGNRSNNVHRISQDGKEHKVVLDSMDGIVQPTCISFDPCRKLLLVINNDGHSVLLYKIH